MPNVVHVACVLWWNTDIHSQLLHPFAGDGRGGQEYFQDLALVARYLRRCLVTAQWDWGRNLRAGVRRMSLQQQKVQAANLQLWCLATLSAPDPVVLAGFAKLYDSTNAPNVPNGFSGVRPVSGSATSSSPNYMSNASTTPATPPDAIRPWQSTSSDSPARSSDGRPPLAPHLHLAPYSVDYPRLGRQSKMRDQFEL